MNWNTNTLSELINLIKRIQNLDARIDNQQCSKFKDFHLVIRNPGALPGEKYSETDPDAVVVIQASCTHLAWCIEKHKEADQKNNKIYIFLDLTKTLKRENCLE